VSGILKRETQPRWPARREAEGGSHRGNSGEHQRAKGVKKPREFAEKGSEEQDGKTVVTCHLVGNFPGSPVDLRFLFDLEGDKIASLEVIP
jgi:hypothetical protein